MKNILFTFSLVVIVVSLSMGQDYNLTGAGARAEGFGGAFIGLADDATAVVWNPAGLAQLERAEASIVTRYISEGIKYNFPFDASLNTEESQGHFSLNFGSIALPISTGETKIVIAAAFQRQMDFYRSSRYEFEDIDNNGPYRGRERTETRGGVNTITPAISVRLSPVISLGFSTNIWLGSIDDNFRTEHSRDGRNIYNLNADYTGLNFVFGGLLDFEGMKNGFPLKLGVTMRTPFKLKNDGTFNIDEEYPNLLADQGNFIIVENFGIKETVEIPLMLGFGMSYRLGDNFTFALDYELRNYGNKVIKRDYSSPTFGDFSANDENISTSKEDLNQLRLGGEYLIVLDNGVIPLRLGYKTVATVLADIDFSTGTLTQVKGSGISFGSGFISDAFALDVTFSATSYTQKFGRFAELEYGIGTLSSSIIIYF